MTQAQETTASERLAPSIDQDTLDIKSLARAVLDRTVRPRVGSVRRLAEAVLAKGDGKPKKGKKGGKKSAKLATIPGQKDRKKKG